MRQVLIAKTNVVNNVSFSTVSLSYGQPLQLTPGLNVIDIPFEIKPIYEAKINFKFELSELLAHNGIMLAGAYYDCGANTIRTMLYNLNDVNAVPIRASDVILVASAYESLMLRQIDAAPTKTEKIDAPPGKVKPKKRR